MSLILNKLLKVVSEKICCTNNEIIAYWFNTPDVHNRMEVKKFVGQNRGDFLVAPLIVRKGFDNPNEVSSHLRATICEHKDTILALHPPPEGGSPIVLLLIARNNFSLPQIASPCELPSWFPRFGGEVRNIQIVDLSNSFRIPINAPEASIPILSSSLYSLDQRITNRLQETTSISNNTSQALLSFILKADPKYIGNVQEYLINAEAKLGNVSTPSGYRPTATRKDTIGSLFINLVSSTSLDALIKPSKKLAKALKLTQIENKYDNGSLIGILFRSHIRDISASVSFVREMMITYFTTAQFVTASKHSDQYPTFSLSLLKSVSDDLRETMERFIDLLVE